MRQKVDRRRWFGQLIPWLTVVTLGIMAGVAAFAYISYQRASTALVIERDRQVAFLSAARLTSELSKFSDELWVLARKKDVYESFLVNQRAALLQARRRLVVFDGGVVLLDNFGKVRGAEPEVFGIYGTDWSGSDFFREQIASTSAFFSNIVNGPIDGSPSVIVSVPVQSENGEFVGVLAGIFRLGEPQVSSFYASIVRLRFGRSGTTYIVDGTGRVLYDSSYKEIGEAFNVPGLPGVALRGHNGALRTRDTAGHEILAAYAPVPGTAWTLVIEEDWAALTSSTQPYSRILLALMALGMILPAVSVVLAIRYQAIETRERSRGEQETHAARSLLRMTLPDQVPMLLGWNVAAHYQPADAAGGDFYDFLILSDGRLMLTLGEVTDKGLSAAHVVATTRAALRSAAVRLLSPAEALADGNKVLCPEVPPDVSLTCLYGILDPSAGRLEFADAGFQAPTTCCNGEVTDLPVSGMPLGARFETQYEQREATIHPGECVAFYSSGLLQTRNTQGETFGPGRLKAILGGHTGDAQQIVGAVLSALEEFTGGRAEQEYDITLVVLKRVAEDRQTDRG
ncbi:MAG: SpoIIE family protein phosphatase [Anaerolineae bacterium]|nr:SpoIIE family protein phosphatase [Anaerolineae bacterium]